MTQLRRVLLYGQQLDGDAKASSAAAVVAALCGVQAQDRSAAELALRPRSSQLTRAAVEWERLEQRTFIRTWCMRGTLHLIASPDARWLLALHGRVFIAASRRRYSQLGLDEETCAKGVRLLRAAAANKPLTRAAAAAMLRKRGIHVTGQAEYHLLRRAALEGAICFGGDDADGEPSYVALHEWIPPAATMGEGEALHELALRYLQANAPASLHDFATWCGLPLEMCRRGWQSLGRAAVEVATPDGAATMLASQMELLDSRAALPRPVRLVPAFDPYLLGHRSRAFCFTSAEGVRRVYPGGGLLRPPVLIDGVCVATWKTERRRGHVCVTVEPFQRIAKRHAEELHAECADIGRFAGVETRLEVRPREARR